jgi:hypothetical protein
MWLAIAAISRAPSGTSLAKVTTDHAQAESRRPSASTRASTVAREIPKTARTRRESKPSGTWTASTRPTMTVEVLKIAET